MPRLPTKTCCARSTSPTRFASKTARLMVQVPEQGATNLVGMKVDFDIKGRGPDPIVRSGKKVTASALEALAQSEHRRSRNRVVAV